MTPIQGQYTCPQGQQYEGNLPSYAYLPPPGLPPLHHLENPSESRHLGYHGSEYVSVYELLV